MEKKWKILCQKIVFQCRNIDVTEYIMKTKEETRKKQTNKKYTTVTDAVFWDNELYDCHNFLDKLAAMDFETAKSQKDV